MDGYVSGFLAWLAPLLSTLITTAMTAYIATVQHRGEQKRDEARKETEAKRAAEARWREDIEGRLDEQDSKIDAVLKGQTTQMRSDLIHRAHRYLDDLGRASTDEKDAFDEEYKDYCAMCEAYGIKNSFIDALAERVMDLPERDV
jgi:predicted phage gp36 major capsid-like protein